MLTLTLPPDVETRVKGEASRQGLATEDYIQKLILEHLPPVGNGQTLADLFADWDAEDATSDPAEISRRNQEVEEFKLAMNQNRLDAEGPGSRKLFP